MGEGARAADVLIIGGGIVGCTTAYELAKQGASVLVLEKTGIASEASGANAGMIGAATGIESDSADFVRASVALLYQAAEELPDSFDLVREGRMMVALTEADVPSRRAVYDDAIAAGFRAEWLDGPAARAVEPALGDAVLAATYLPDDGQIDPVLTTQAYARAAQRLGARIETGVTVTALLTAGGRIAGVRTLDGDYTSSQVVLAAGAWSAQLAATVDLDVPVTPGKGQMLATEPLPPLTGRVVRAAVLGIRQNTRGEVIGGSTVEYVGFDKTVDADEMRRRLDVLGEMIPALKRARIGRTWAGLRPMSPDSLPIVGAVQGIDGLWLATGHSRSGMSYAPGTGKAVADLIVQGATDLPLAKFAIDRFAATPVATPAN